MASLESISTCAVPSEEIRGENSRESNPMVWFRLFDSIVDKEHCVDNRDSNEGNFMCDFPSSRRTCLTTRELP